MGKGRSPDSLEMYLLNNRVPVTNLLVLDNGKLVGNGTHDELMNNCNIYKEIALSQEINDEVGE